MTDRILFAEWAEADNRPRLLGAAGGPSPCPICGAEGNLCTTHPTSQED
jgi:hypothetical protein